MEKEKGFPNTTKKDLKREDTKKLYKKVMPKVRPYERITKKD